MAIESVQYIVELIDKETSLPLHSSPKKNVQSDFVCRQGRLESKNKNPASRYIRCGIAIYSYKKTFTDASVVEVKNTFPGAQ